MSGANQLAALIDKLFKASREDGKQRSHTTEKGLKLTVSTYPDTWIALSRTEGQPSMLEAETVAKHANWGSLYSADWENIGGKRYLLIRPDYSDEPVPVDDEPPVVDLAVPPTAPDGGPPDEAIRALLLSPGPWHKEISLQGPPESRERIVQSFRRCQLLDWLRWINTKFPTRLTEYKQSRGTAL